MNTKSLPYRRLPVSEFFTWSESVKQSTVESPFLMNFGSTIIKLVPKPIRIRSEGSEARVDVHIENYSTETEREMLTNEIRLLISESDVYVNSIQCSDDFTSTATRQSRTATN